MGIRTAASRETPERRREIATEATRTWRFNAARRRVQQIAAGTPPLTDDQREQLAQLLCPGGHGASA